MKPTRTLMICILMVAILFASALPASAIGFDAEKAYESVFVIYSGNSLGSGFAVGNNCIVTNAHVIDDPRNITIVTYGGAEYRAGILGIDEWADIAVLVVQDASFPYLPIADLSTMHLGDDIYAIGAPKGMTYTLTKGGVSAKERIVGNQSYIQIDAAINKGNSGGPLLNDAGQVLGMNTLKMTDSEGIGLAIPVNRICAFLQELGLQLNADGNISGVITAPVTPSTRPQQPETQPPSTDPDVPPKTPPAQPETSEAPAITYWACCIAVLSLAGNVVLAIALNRERKKATAASYDPSERTDFEIDIWE